MESISRISSMLETARDLTLEAAQSASSLRTTDSGPRSMPNVQVKRLLDSRSDRDVLEGLRRVISMTYRSQPTQTFFTAVVKNIASPSVAVKKLVYIYLLHHAEAEPDMALLSINTIQKSLSDANPSARAIALKTMSGIRVPVISPIIALAIKKAAGDMSPLVRKAAAQAIPKCYRLDPGTLPQLIEYLTVLLADRQYYVVGAAVAAFCDVCPERIDLIHPHYRSLVRKLVDMDEWGQLATLRLMTFYARKCFPKRTRRISSKLTSTIADFYGESQSNGNSEVKDHAEGGAEDREMEIQVLDPDLELLLKACGPLLQSRNSAVVVAVTRCYLYLGTPAYLDSAVGPLIALLRGPQDTRHVALCNMVSVCLVRPKQFVRYATHFLVHTTDAPPVWQLKIEMLSLVFPHCGAHMKSVILNELEHFSRGTDRALVRESVRAIGRCAQSGGGGGSSSSSRERGNDDADNGRTAARCMRLLLQHIASPDGNLVAESLTVMRHLIQQDPAAHNRTVIRLAKRLDSVTNPEARATIIWLVGEFAGVDDGDNNIAADVLRLLARGFAAEPEPAKLQIVLLAAKVYVHHLNRTQDAATASVLMPKDGHSQDDTDQKKDERGGFASEPGSAPRKEKGPSTEATEHPIPLLWNYILLLARYDTSYDLRDRARLYRSLLAVPSSTQLATLLLLAPKPVPHAPSPSEGRKAFQLGSASLVIGEQDSGPHGLSGYAALPDWVEAGKEPDARLRDEKRDEKYTAAKYGGGERREMSAAEKLDSALRAGNAGNLVSGLAKTNVAKKQQQQQQDGVGSGTVKEKTLDDWLAESEEEDEDEEGEEEESTDDDEDEDDEEDDEEDENDEEEEEETSEESSDLGEESERDTLVKKAS
ncbi:MAG: hypothetical protein M1825_003123 [Sarcosagium campestre]|nr:MAG: hypothetical protein M1825_003123 [Sarcosagium campestre]